MFEVKKVYDAVSDCERITLKAPRNIAEVMINFTILNLNQKQVWAEN